MPTAQQHAETKTAHLTSRVLANGDAGVTSDTWSTAVYEDFIPVGDVTDRVFNFQPVEKNVQFTVPADAEADLDPKLTVVADLGGHVLVEDPTRKTVVRSDTHLPFGNFREGYVPHEYNEWLIDVPAKLVDESRGELGIVGAGTHRNGAVGYVQIAPRDPAFAADDALHPYLIAATSLDGSLATTIVPSALRMYCTNALSMALHTAVEKVRYRHTRYSQVKVDDARVVLNMFVEQQDEYIAAVEEAMATPVSTTQFRHIIEALDPEPTGEDATDRKLDNWTDRVDEYLELWTNDERVHTTGNLWAVEQVFNTRRQHDATFRRTEGVSTRSERNSLSLLTGAADRQDGKVLEAAREVLAA